MLFHDPGTRDDPFCRACCACRMSNLPELLFRRLHRWILYDGATTVACYWTNGVKTDLPGNGGAVANSIFVSGSTVYAAGYYNTAAPVACYWTNGVKTDLPVPGVRLRPNASVHIRVGRHGLHCGLLQRWRDLHRLLLDGYNKAGPPGLGGANANSIFVSGGTIYTAGVYDADTLPPSPATGRDSAPRKTSPAPATRMPIPSVRFGRDDLHCGSVQRFPDAHGLLLDGNHQARSSPAPTERMPLPSSFRAGRSTLRDSTTPPRHPSPATGQIQQSRTSPGQARMHLQLMCRGERSTRRGTTTPAGRPLPATGQEQQRRTSPARARRPIPSSCSRTQPAGDYCPPAH